MPESQTRDIQENLKLRVPAVQESIRRARSAFFVCVLASLASFLCLWNTYLSFNRDFVFHQIPPGLRSLKSSEATSCIITLPKIPTANTIDENRARLPEDACREEMRAELFKDLAKAWIDSQSVNLNLLGIRIGVCDFAVLNTIAMYLFVYYCLLSVRRENREVGHLLWDMGGIIEAKEATVEMKGLAYSAYSAICAHMVFNLNENDDQPIQSVKGTQPKVKAVPRIRTVFKVMTYFPIGVVVFTMVCDLGSVLLPYQIVFGSPLRLIPLRQIVFHGSHAVYFALSEVFAVVGGYQILSMVRESLRYDSSTRDTLQSYRDLLRETNSIPVRSIDGGPRDES